MTELLSYLVYDTEGSANIFKWSASANDFFLSLVGKCCEQDFYFDSTDNQTPECNQSVLQRWRIS